MRQFGHVREKALLGRTALQPRSQHTCHHSTKPEPEANLDHSALAQFKAMLPCCWLLLLLPVVVVVSGAAALVAASYLCSINELAVCHSPACRILAVVPIEAGRGGGGERPSLVWHRASLSVFGKPLSLSAVKGGCWESAFGFWRFSHLWPSHGSLTKPLSLVARSSFRHSAQAPWPFGLLANDPSNRSCAGPFGMLHSAHS